MKAEIVFSSVHDDVITIDVSKEDYQFLLRKEINHVWVSRKTLPSDEGFVGEFRLK